MAARARSKAMVIATESPCRAWVWNRADRWVPWRDVPDLARGQWLLFAVTLTTRRWTPDRDVEIASLPRIFTPACQAAIEQLLSTLPPPLTLHRNRALRPIAFLLAIDHRPALTADPHGGSWRTIPSGLLRPIRI